MHPVPQGLTVHAAGFGRRLAKLRSRQIKSGDRYRRSHRCRSSQRTASSQSFTDLGIPNESQFRATGIRQYPYNVLKSSGTPNFEITFASPKSAASLAVGAQVRLTDG